MVNVAQEIKAYLDSLGTLGKIVCGSIPAEPDEIGVIHEYGGRPPDFQFGHVGIKYEKPSIQVLFRGAPHDYDLPMHRARIAWAALAEVQPGRLPGALTEYLMIAPQQSPFSLGKDENKRFEIVCNFYIDKEL